MCKAVPAHLKGAPPHSIARPMVKAIVTATVSVEIALLHQSNGAALLLLLRSGRCKVLTSSNWKARSSEKATAPSAHT